MKTRRSGRQQTLNITDGTLAVKQELMSRVDAISGDSIKSNPMASETTLPPNEMTSYIRKPSIYFHKQMTIRVL